MAGKASNIIVGAARVWVSYGAGSYRPDLSGSVALPFKVNLDSFDTSTTTSGSISTPAWVGGTGSAYWRDLGFTSTGVDISYEPGYSDVVVDQLLDAARLFQQSLKVVIKTELDEGTFENMNFVFGQQEIYKDRGSSNDTDVDTLKQVGSPTAPTASAAAMSKLNLAAGSLGISPIERSLLFVGNAPGNWGTAADYPVTAGSGATTGSATLSGTTADVSAIRRKERVYVARRIIQEQTTAHALKRDAATVFPVSFRALPDADRDSVSGGSEYGFIIDRVYGTV